MCNVPIYFVQLLVSVVHDQCADKRLSLNNRSVSLTVTIAPLFRPPRRRRAISVPFRATAHTGPEI